MPKSKKFIEKVPSLSDYKPDWVNEDGEITDPAKVIKLVHTMISDKAKAQDSREDALADNAELVTERDALQEQVDDKNAPDAQAEIAKATKRADAAEAQSKKDTDRADRLEVAMDKGLTPAQAKRLQGENKEELEADADEILELFGQKPETEEEREAREEQEAEEAANSVSTSPRSKPRLTNGGAPRSGADAEPDYEAIAAQIGTQNPFG